MSKLDEARRLAAQGNLPQAFEIYNQLQETHKDDASFWAEFGGVCLRAGHVNFSIKCLEQQFALEPQNHKLAHIIGKSLYQSGEALKAQNYLKRAYALHLSYIYAHDLALCYYYNNLLQEAVQIIEEAKKLASNELEHSNVALLLGNIFADLGQKDEYMKIYASCLDMKMPNFVMFSQYARAKKITEIDRKGIEKYEKFIPEASNWPAHHELFFGLGKAYDDLGDYKKSAEYHDRANLIASAISPFNRDSINYVSSTVSYFNKDIILEKQKGANLSERPIFIMGLPRSGTSLVEQILSGSEDVYGCGELVFIEQLSKKLVLQNDAGEIIQYPYSISYANEKFFDLASNSYLNAVTSINDSAKFTIDKMPANFLFLGFIKMILPNSKIIHTARDPRDTALSLYFVNFREGGMSFTYSWNDILFFMENYFKIMQHWRNNIPEMYHEVKYGELIENFESEAKKLYEFCSIEWTKEAIKFHEKDRSVLTASRFQVRQPIYKSSKEKWRSYEFAYKKQFEAISQLAEKYGYSW